MIFRTMFGNFSFPLRKVCLLSATQIPHKICTALSKKMSGLQELLKTWKECISLPISSQPCTTPSLRNLKTQHVKHTSNINATLHTFPHCNQHMRNLKTQHTHISTTQNILHITYLLLHSHYQKYYPFQTFGSYNFALANIAYCFGRKGSGKISFDWKRIPSLPVFVTD